MVFPQLLRSSKSCLKLALDISDCLSFAPEWIIIFVMDVGREASISGILSTRRAVVIPGRQWIIASTKWTCRIMESPIIAVVGGFFGAGTALGTTGGTSDGVVLHFVDFVGWESDLDRGRGEEGTSNLRWTAFFNRLWRSFL